tara:strand:+ start:19180 stop:20895 length:1716 start_codon:yes stop_codon:yes gene_type:complete
MKKDANKNPSSLAALDKIAHFGTYACRAWRIKIIARHPWFTRPLANEYERIALADGYIAANQWLLQFEKSLKLGRTGLFVDCNDDDIKQYCEVKTKSLFALIASLSQAYGSKMYKQVIREVAAKFELIGIPFPLNLSREYDKQAAIAALARITDPIWLRRKLRTQAARQLENICRNLGIVSNRKAPYVSDYTLRRRTEQRYRNRKLLERHEAVNIDTGFKSSLADIVDSSVSNPINRRNEYMTRVRGSEDCANAMGFKAVFLTVTCPSAYHAVSHKTGNKNPKFGGYSPIEAQAYLNKVWAKTRAKWHRNDIRCFGFRVTEPNHDGTPHWHLLLFFAPDVLHKAVDILKEYAMEVSPDELGASKYRFDCELIDTSKGSATGYISKYISKNIDGLGLESESDFETNKKALDSIQRVEAWASTWGIHQFQQIGSTSVTVWRELRRLREPLEHASLEELEQLRAACDTGDWGRFIELMGGPLVKRADMPVRALHVISEQSDETSNKYGEMTKRLQGVVMRGSVKVITRIHEWRIQLADRDEVVAQFDQREFYQTPYEPDVIFDRFSPSSGRDYE